MRKISSIFLMLALVLISCENDDNSPAFPKEEKVIHLSPQSEAMVAIDNQFGIEIFKRMIVDDPGKNLMISPLSISQALLMTYNGASGDTKNAFENTLFLGDLTSEEINQAQKDLVEALLEVDPGVIISVANSIWYREGFSVKPEFLQINQNYYNAEAQNVAFDQSTVDLINNWVSDKTNGKIDEIIESIDPLAMMFLINAVYFKGNWKYTFEESSTSNHDFHLSDGNVVNAPFMNQEITAKLMFHADFTILELPYGRGNFSMLIFLPDESKTIADIIEAWDNASYNDWLSNLSEMAVELSIPKFKFKYDKFLDNYLKEMGLAVAYDPFNADFTNITDEIDLHIDFVKHKSFIEVNEKGTEAAAVTIVGVGTTSIDPSYPKFVADRPFLFAIREKYTNSILFMGRVENPLEE